MNTNITSIFSIKRFLQNTYAIALVSLKENDCQRCDVTTKQRVFSTFSSRRSFPSTGYFKISLNSTSGICSKNMTAILSVQIFNVNVNTVMGFSDAGVNVPITVTVCKRAILSSRWASPVE